MKSGFFGFMKFGIIIVALAQASGIHAAQSPGVTRLAGDAPKRILFVGNSYDYYGKVDREVAAFLQQVAHDTVTRFYGRR